MNLKQSLNKYELALIPIILSLFLGLHPGFESVKAQSELGCAELRGAIRAMSAFLDGVMLELAGEHSDPGAEGVLDALTQALAHTQQEYSINC